MQERGRKNFKFKTDTIEKLDEIKNVTGINNTQLIEATIDYLHREYKKLLRGSQYDEVMIEEVLGNRIKKLLRSS